MIYKFGLYEFDPSELELRCGTTRKALTPAMNRLLVLLVTKPGELVTREQIAEVLWDSQESVDVVAGINTAMRRLRTTIGDNNGQGSLIQTVVGMGYRFAATVTVVPKITVVQDLPLIDPLVEPKKPVRSSRRTLLAVCAIVFVIAGICWWGYSRWSSHTDEKVDVPHVEHMQPATFDELEEKLTAEAVSPSGKYLAYADVYGVTVKSLATGDKKTMPVLKGSSVERIAWFADEASLLLSAHTPPPQGKSDQAAAPDSQVWILPIANAVPSMVLDDSDMAAPSPDGHDLAYLRSDKTELWISGAHGDAPHKVAQAANGNRFSYVLWSPQGDKIIADEIPLGFVKLAGANLVSDKSGNPPKVSDSSSGGYDCYDFPTGSLLAHRDDIVFDSASILNDGRLIYPIIHREGTTQLAAARIDLRTGALRGDPTVLSDVQAFGMQVAKAQHLSFSADGGSVAFLREMRNVDVFTASIGNVGSGLALTNIARLSKRSFGNYPNAWTPDGSAVVYDSGSNGPISLYEQPLAGGDYRPLAQAKAVTDKFALAKFSPDGKWLLYLTLDPKTDKVASINRVPAAGGQPAVVPTTGEVEGFQCSIAPQGRCVLRVIEGNRQFVYYELDPVKGVGRELARTPLITHLRGDWTISPDGTTVAVANHHPEHPSIQLVPLASSDSTNTGITKTKDLPIHGHGVVLGPAWASDGHGLFVETSNPDEYHLLYADLQGHLTLLHQSPNLLYATPSPNGKMIAFPGNTPVNRNVWLGTMK